MSITATREALIGGDLDTWGPYEQAHNHLAIGVCTMDLFLDGAALKLRKGRMGLYDGVQYWVVSDSADEALSLVGLIVSCWARVEAQVVASVASVAIASIAGETNPAVLPTSFTGAYDGTKGGYYISATKRCIGLVWIDAAGAANEIVNVRGNCNLLSTKAARSGYAAKSANFSVTRVDGVYTFNVTTGTGGAGDVTGTMPACDGTNGRVRFVKVDTGTNKAIMDGNGTEKIGVEGNALTFDLYARGDWVEVEDMGTYWAVVGTNGPVVEYTSASDVAGSTSAGVWANPASHSISEPAGVWEEEYRVAVDLTPNANVPSSRAALSTANNSASDSDMVSMDYLGVSNAILRITFTAKSPRRVRAATTTMYLNIFSENSAATMVTKGTVSKTCIRARRVG